MWLDQVKQAHGGQEPIDITWKPFALNQVNQKVGPDYKVWDEPEDKQPSGLWGLRAGVAASHQGNEALKRFLPLLLKARHIERKEVNDLALLKRLAGEAALDVERFERDLRDPSSLQEVVASHTKAVAELGVFGTPTFIFPNGAAAFLKMLRPDTAEEASKAYDSLIAMMQGSKFIGEVKRPQPPWPRGAFTQEGPGTGRPAGGPPAPSTGLR